MIVDARGLADGSTIRADVVVVGAGAAGITLARDLAASAKRVCLLESGELLLNAQVQTLSEGTGRGEASDALLVQSRLRMLGGSTQHWAGWCAPLQPEDLEPRPWIDPAGWPLTMADLLPHYQRAQGTCGLAPLGYGADELASLSGRPLLDLDPSVVRTSCFQYSEPRNFGTYYEAEIEAAADIECYTNATAVEVVLTDDGARVQHVRCTTLTGVRFQVEASDVVLALGGLENARLLLASNRQVPEGVGNGSGQVGKRFMEHPHYYRVAQLVTGADVDLSFYQRHDVPVADAALGQPPQPAMGVLSMSPDLAEAEELVGISVQIEPLGELDAEQDGLAPGVVAALPGVVSGELQVAQLTLRCEQRPTELSAVTLSDAVDVVGMPRIVLDWQLDDRDALSMGRGLRALGAAFAAAGLGRLAAPFDGERFAPPDGALQPGFHHMGTTRMGGSPAEAVVDAQGQVFGVGNLFLAGSSTFPTSGWANPTLTVVALAHRLADHLAAR